MTRRRALAGLVVAVAVTGCAGQQTERLLPTGAYAGSTADRRAVTVDVVGSSVSLNGRKLRREPGNIYVTRKKAPRTELTCTPRHKGEELRCRITGPGGAAPQTVDLMGL